jgi:hypothetical protein
MQNDLFLNTDFGKLLLRYLKPISDAGRARILQDLKTVNSQRLAIGNGTRSISKVANPRIAEIYGALNALQTKENKTLDKEFEINWEETKKGAANSVHETRKAAKFILLRLKEIYIEVGGQENCLLLLNEFKASNNFSIFRLLSPLRYRSLSPGKALVGKQYGNNIKNPGFVHEHVVPVDFYFKHFNDIIKGSSSIDLFDKISEKIFSVQLNSDDDLKLKAEGLNKKMPERWTWDDDPFDRYRAAGIDLNTILPIR